MQDKKKQKRVSFAAEEPEKNLYEREQTFNSLTTDDITADITIEQTRIRNSFFEETKSNEINEEVRNTVSFNDYHKKDDFHKDNGLNENKEETFNFENIHLDKIANDDIIFREDINNNRYAKDKLNNIKHIQNQSIDNLENIYVDNNTMHQVEDKINLNLENNKKQILDIKNSTLNRRLSTNKNDYSLDKSSVLEDKENETIMSNTTVVFDELITTQYIRNIVQPKAVPNINLNEVLAELGIRFLDDIVVSSTRRETLSKSRKDIDLSLVNYYRNFLLHRISFFDNFCEYIKDNLLNLQDSIKKIESNFDIKGTLLETNDKSNLRSLKTDSRTRARVSWYDIRAKKELEFNEMIINKKNELISMLNNKDSECNKLVNDINEAQKNYEDLDYTLKNLTSEINTTKITEDSIRQLNDDILNHEKVLESYKLEINKLEEQYTSKKLRDEMEERKAMELKNEIQELEKQFKNSTISEDDLDKVRNEYEKTVSLLGMNFIEYNSEFINLEFLNTYIIKLNKNNLQIECKCSDKIFQFSKVICKDMTNLKDILYKLNLLHEFYKELQIVKDFASTEASIKNDTLFVSIKINDIQNMQTKIFSVEVKPNMEVTIDKNGETFMYNLFFNKGALFDHVI